MTKFPIYDILGERSITLCQKHIMKKHAHRELILLRSDRRYQRHRRVRSLTTGHFCPVPSILLVVK
jgi:hypothetical protein